MGVVDKMLIDMPDEVANANSVKSIVLTKLYEDKVLTEHQLEKYNNGFHVIIIKQSWFKGVLKRLKLTNSVGYIYRFVEFRFNKNES